MILKTIFPWYVCPSFLVSAWFLGKCYWHRMIVKQAWLSDCHRSNEHQWMMSWETISQDYPSQYPIINHILQFNRLYWYHRYLMGQFMGFSSFTVLICWAGRVSRGFRTFFLDVQKKSLEMGTKRIFGAYSTRVGDLFQRYFGGEMRMINHHGVFFYAWDCTPSISSSACPQLCVMTAIEVQFSKCQPSVY